jgi:hypothetical protein
LKNSLTDQYRINTRVILIISIAVIVTCVADSSILRLLGILKYHLIGSSNIELYVIFLFVAAVSSIVLLFILGKNRNRIDIEDTHSPKSTTRKNLTSDFLIICLVQLVIIGVLVAIMFQMFFTRSYFTFELSLVVYSTFLVTFIFLARLFLRFYNWYHSKRNRLFLLYCVLFIILLANFSGFLSYFTFELSHHSLVIKPISARMFFAILYSPSPEIERNLNFIYDILTLMSFVAGWLTTTVLLNSYSKKIGVTKYWFLICIPLIYFLSRYDVLISPVIQYLGLSGAQFNVSYLIFVSAGQQIGGVLFGIYYWVASRNVLNQRLKNYLVLSAIGMIFIFAANEIHALLVTFFPPFGLITVSFMGLGSYLLFIGIFELATLISRNSEIRNELNRKVQELSLVKNIGRSEIERIVEGQVRKASKSVPKEESDIRSYVFEHEELEELVKEVMNEVNLRKRSTKKTENDKE